jgi:hypothetical protein
MVCGTLTAILGKPAKPPGQTDIHPTKKKKKIINKEHIAKRAGHLELQRKWREVGTHTNCT